MFTDFVPNTGQLLEVVVLWTRPPAPVWTLCAIVCLCPIPPRRRVRRETRVWTKGLSPDTVDLQLREKD